MVRVFPPLKMSCLIGFPSKNKTEEFSFLYILNCTPGIMVPFSMPAPLRFRSTHWSPPGNLLSCSSLQFS